jgi:hypothetical protein
MDKDRIIEKKGKSDMSISIECVILTTLPGFDPSKSHHYRIAEPLLENAATFPFDESSLHHPRLVTFRP